MAASAREVQNLQTTVVGLQGNPVAPGVPVVGDALVWDGTQWLPSAPPPPAPPLNGPIIGVTDGSNAAPGMVGEFLTATGNVASPVNGVNNNVGTAEAGQGTVVQLSLPAGDWQVDWFCNFGAGLQMIGSQTSPFPTGYLDASLINVSAISRNAGPFTYLLGSAVFAPPDQVNSSMSAQARGAQRVNISSASTLSVACTLFFNSAPWGWPAGAGPTINATINARRMR